MRTILTVAERRRRAASRALALALAGASLAGCMFFRSLNDLSGGAGDGGAPANDGGGAEGAIGPVADGAVDAAPIEDAGPSFCAVVDPAIADGEAPLLTKCFDYDVPDAGAVLTGALASVGIEADDGPSPPNAFVVRAPALPSTGGNGRHLVDVPFVARRVEMAFDVRFELTPGQASDYVQIATFFRDDVYSYLVYDVARSKVFFAEQDQRDGGLVNTTLPHTGLVVDLSRWHRMVLDLDYVAETVSLRIVGGESTLGEKLEWPKVSWYGVAWLGSSFIYGNKAPLTMHYDDFALNVW